MNKTYSIQLKSLDISNRIVEGYFSSFNELDSDGDIVVKGAFLKSIQENGPASTTKRIKHLFNHWDTVGVLQELNEDSFGLHYISKIGTHSLGNDVLRMYDDGIITEHSIGFKTIKEQPDTERNANIIQEVMLWEGSSLDKWGANMNTPVIKTIDEFAEWGKQWEKRFEAIYKALHGRTNYTDAAYENFELQLLQLKEAFVFALEQVKPLKSTSTKEPQEKTLKDAIDFNKLTNLILK